jgi:hypothetical protein
MRRADHDGAAPSAAARCSSMQPVTDQAATQASGRASLPYLFPAPETPRHHRREATAGEFTVAVKATQMTLTGGQVSDSTFDKLLLAGRPLTESNRRPSPYHRSPASP